MSEAIDYDKFEKTQRYTYADYIKWEGPERYQLINGEIYQMASPSVEHQAIVRDLIIQFGNWLKDKPCQVFPAPLDVRLFPQKDKSDNTVLQPDILVVCDKKKLSKNSIDGAPDMVIEVISPSNTHAEQIMKFNYYLKAGVREFWVIEPETKRAQVNVYENGRYLVSVHKVGYFMDDTSIFSPKGCENAFLK
jgi:Uma2 family endonuclease